MANDYCTLAEAKAALPDTSWSTAYDAILTALITRGSRAIDKLANYWPGAFFMSLDETRYFDGSGTRQQWVDHLAAVPTTVAVAETGITDTDAGSGGSYSTWLAADYMLWPRNALKNNEPYQRLDVDAFNGSKVAFYAFRRGVKVTGKFGYSTAIPDDVKQAAIIQAIRWFKRGQQAYRDTGAIVELGQLTYTQALDPDVAETLKGYRRGMFG